MRTLQELAKEVIAVQDACNLSGVVHGFSRAMTDLWNNLQSTGAGTAEINRHPISIMWSSKIESLTQSQDFNTFSDAYDWCKAQAQEVASENS